tara:strand:- start:789 stop:926 length:138 start_codon:yes stop_codon:yes gene_type:complete
MLSGLLIGSEVLSIGNLILQVLLGAVAFLHSCLIDCRKRRVATVN